MNVPVYVEQLNGHYLATASGLPEIRAESSNRDQAVEEVRQQLREKVTSGQLVLVDVDFVGVSGLAGSFKHDPTILEIAAEAYRLRDEQKASEMAEYDRP